MFNKSRNLNRFLVVGLCTIIMFVISCAGSRSGSAGNQVSDELASDTNNKKVEVEAYLFDAKFRKKGKPTSFRLELFQSDSVIGMFGRGYVGKGILKGTLSRDSLALYFPTSGEYFIESTGKVLTELPCQINAPSLDIFDLFSTLPDSIVLDSAVVVISDYSNRKKPEFSLSVPGCEWEINLKYDFRKGGWRLLKFEYQGGDNTSLKATRREFRNRVRVKPNRLQVNIPESAVRIVR